MSRIGCPHLIVEQANIEFFCVWEIKSTGIPFPPR